MKKVLKTWRGYCGIFEMKKYKKKKIQNTKLFNTD